VEKMKIEVCELCFYEGTLTKAKYNSSRKSGVVKISLAVCEKHKDFLKDRNNKKIGELQQEISEIQDNYYKVQKSTKE
jgi:hypothetical protein